MTWKIDDIVMYRDRFQACMWGVGLIISVDNTKELATIRWPRRAKWVYSFIKMDRDFLKIKGGSIGKNK